MSIAEEIIVSQRHLAFWYRGCVRVAPAVTTPLYYKMAALSDEARIRELAEVIRSKCAQAQQIRQQPPGVSVTSAPSAINLQVW